MRSGSGRERGNCIAIVDITHLAEENVPPMAALCGDGELERGLAGRVAEDCGTGGQAEGSTGTVFTDFRQLRAQATRWSRI